MKKNPVSSPKKLKISSPSQLDEYLKVSSPSLFIVATAAVVLLFSFVAWASLGLVPTKMDVLSLVKNDVLTIYLNEEESQKVNQKMEVLVKGNYYPIKSIDKTPVTSEALKASLDETLYLQLNPPEKSYPIQVDVKNIPDGVVPAGIVIEKIRPINFFFKKL